MERIPGTNIPLPLPARERFMAFVSIDSGSGCWLWIGFCKANGYGDFSLGNEYGMPGRSIGAHRAAYIMFNKVSPESLKGKIVRHRCDTPNCVNPDHLVIGTQKDNIDDAIARGRQVCGDRVGTSKLTEADVFRIYELNAAGLSRAAIAEMYGITPTNVWMVVTGRSWGHLYHG